MSIYCFKFWHQISPPIPSPLRVRTEHAQSELGMHGCAARPLSLTAQEM